MVEFEDLHVDYHQMVVTAGGVDDGGIELYSVGGRLLQLSGRSQATVFTGPYMGAVRVRAAGLLGPPTDDAAGWEAVEEVTIWAPTGAITVYGLMSDALVSQLDLTVTGPGLYRVQARARHRRADDGVVESSTQWPPPEQHEILTWPVGEDVGHATLRVDQMPDASWDPEPERAAMSGMLGILTGSCCDPFDLNRPPREPSRPDPAGMALADVRRHAFLPVPADVAVAALRGVLGLMGDGTGVVPVGPLRIVLTARAGTKASAGLELSWRWAWAGDVPPDPDDDDQAWASLLTLPEPVTTRVSIGVTEGGADGGCRLAVVHHRVLGCDAVPLGLVWEYYLAEAAARAIDPGRAGTEDDLPWTSVLDRLVRQARQERETTRRFADVNERRMFGGRPLTRRLRELQAATAPVAQLDRDFLDALAEAPPERQRAVLVWTVRRACTVARLVEVSWIAEAVDALDRGEPLPASLVDAASAWDRLFADPALPSTLVTAPDGTPNCLQQAMAFPALLAAAAPDPLAGAVDAIYAAYVAYGDARAALPRHLRDAFPDLDLGAVP